MTRKKMLWAGAVLPALLLLASTAQAHLTLTEPMARTDDIGLTEGHCGGIPAGDPVKTYKAGSEIRMTVDLVIAHVDTMQAYISTDGFTTKTELATVVTLGSGNYVLEGTLPEMLMGPAVIQATDGTYVSCADVTLAEAAPFAINAGLNDAWYYPETGGQGFFIIVFPDIHQVFLSWFTFDTERPPEDAEAVLGEPGQRWFTAQGPYVDNVATLDIVMTQGGVFDSAEPAASNSESGSVGYIDLEFENCMAGVVRYDMPGLGLSGEVPIQRISNDNVALCEALTP